MVFQFGSTPAPASTPAPTGGTGTASGPSLFSNTGAAFGNTSTSTSTPAVATAQAGVPQDAKTPSKTAPSKGATGSAPGGAALFGGSTPATAPAPSATPGTALPTFGASTSTTQVPPAPSGFSGASQAATPTALAPTVATNSFTFSGGVAPPTPGSTLLQVPEFDTVFPNLDGWSTLKVLCSKLFAEDGETRLIGQDLVQFLCRSEPQFGSVGEALANPQVLKWSPPDEALRQQLSSKPIVLLPTNKEASLSQTMLEDVLHLATDLRIPETHAITLYAAALQAATRSMLAGVGESLMDKVFDKGEQQRNDQETAVAVRKAARDLYFLERSRPLKSLLLLLQLRIRGQEILLRATDGMIKGGLVGNLIDLIRQWTVRIFQLEHELSSGQRNGQTHIQGISMNQHVPNQTKKAGFAKVHLVFAQEERQMAVECLFYLAYTTQLTGDEVVGIIDLIRDLTNGMNGTDGLVLLNPFTDVPAPFETPPQGAHTSWATPFSSFNPSLKEKNALEWQKELFGTTWNSGAPHLLNSIAPLVLSAICAMNVRHVLMDRDLHAPNAFGAGNKLLPPGDDSADRLRSLHERLKPNAGDNWKRRDIWGLLAASYALLLRSAPTLLSSPRAGVPSPSIDVRGAFRACLELPTVWKSFTFARLSLIPTLQRLNNPKPDLVDRCDNVEFFLSVLSEFVSQYLDVLYTSGDMPTSRDRWEKEAKEELRLRRIQQQQQRQFQAWSGMEGGDSEVLHASIDLMKRPDCMDDLIGLAAKLCSLGPDYARPFWGTSGDSEVLSPSHVLLGLERLQGMDESLIPCYLSFLSGLACANDGAAAVDEILSRIPDSADGASGSTSINWYTIMKTIRLYTKALMPLEYDSVSSSKATATSTGSSTNTAYYYLNDGTSRSSGPIQSSREAASRSSSTKPKELGDWDVTNLSSHLSLIMSVARRSAASRCKVLSIRLPVVDGGPVDGGDETLLVLFALAKAPLSPELRGATLSTISCLLEITEATLDQLQLIRKGALMGWDCVESCQFLPIPMLDQYQQDVVPDGGQRRAGMGFPPSSTALAAGGESNSMLPADPNYGLVYEMEHIESRMGWYPSTEGFLQLITSLVKAAGCPSQLGQGWRIRLGCCPYVDYVIDFVLPRALGTPNVAAPLLPFRVRGDLCRLVARALAVVEAVIRRYAVPSRLLKTKASSCSTKTALGVKAIEEMVQSPVEDEEMLVDDYRNQSVSQYMYQQTTNSGGFHRGLSAQHNSKDGIDTAGTSIPAIPRPKSPGFVVLADILSLSGGNLFHAVAKCLISNDMVMPASFGMEADQAAMTYALFGDTPPTMSSAKAGAQQSQTTKSLASLLRPLLPAMGQSMIEVNSFDDAVAWRERSIILALRILCATAVREEAFRAAIVSAQNPLKIVPFLRFQRKSLGPSSLRVLDVQVSRLLDVLSTSDLSSRIRRSIVNYIGYVTADEQHDQLIAAFAISLFHFLYQSAPRDQGVHTLDGFGTGGAKDLARAMATRLNASSKRPSSILDSQVIGLVLNLILDELRSGSMANDSLAQVVLGLPSATKGGNWGPNMIIDTTRPVDCFDAILGLLGDEEYIVGSATCQTAALCFEILFRLYDSLRSGADSELRSALYTAERLRHIDFWRTNVRMLLTERRTDGTSPLKRAMSAELSGGDNILHAIAWLLKGVSCEIRLLAGIAHGHAVDQNIAVLISPRPRMCEDLLFMFFGSPDALIRYVVRDLPLIRSLPEPFSVAHSKERFEGAKLPLPGAADVVGGYVQVNPQELLDSSIGKSGAGDVEKWAKDWNDSVAWDCASSHLSNSIHILLGSSLSSLKSLQCYTSFDPSRVAALRSCGLIDIMTQILNRLLTIPQQARSMDECFFPAATRNLSSAVLLLSDRLVDPVYSNELVLGDPSGADIATLCALLSKALAFSGQGAEHSYEASIMNERTTLLGSALTAMLRSFSGSEPDFTSRHSDGFLLAAATLSRLSCFRADEENAAVAVLARTSLCSLIGACNTDESSSTEQSFLYKVLPPPTLNRLLSLVATLDEHVSTLLECVVMQPFGGELLLHSGVFNALTAAAEKYMAEEMKVKSMLASPGFIRQKHSLSAPPFLMGHLKLLSALMASHDTSSHYNELCNRVLATLGRYDALVKRLFEQFPFEADLLRQFVTCLGQAAAMMSPPLGLQDKIGGAGSYDSSGGSFKRGLLTLCPHLWEHPLPLSLLRELPRALSITPVAVESDVVIVNKEHQQTWWDALDMLLQEKPHVDLIAFPPPTGQDHAGRWNGDSHWNDLKFEYCMLAVDIITLGVSFMKRTGITEDLDLCSILRGLCRCADASWSVESRIRIAQSYSGPSAGNMVTDEERHKELEQQYLTLVAEKLTRSVEELLSLGLMCFRKLKLSKNMSQVSLENLSRIISDSLDHAGLESRTRPSRSDFSKQLCNEMRNELILEDNRQ